MSQEGLVGRGTGPLTVHEPLAAPAVSPRAFVLVSPEHGLCKGRAFLVRMKVRREWECRWKQGGPEEKGKGQVGIFFKAVSFLLLQEQMATNLAAYDHTNQSQPYF